MSLCRKVDAQDFATLCYAIVPPGRKSGFRPRGMASELVYRAEHWCKSKGCPGRGLSQAPPGAGLGREAAQNLQFPVLPPFPNKNLKFIVAALETRFVCECIWLFPVTPGHSRVAPGVPRYTRAHCRHTQAHPGIYIYIYIYIYIFIDIHSYTKRVEFDYRAGHI